MQATVLQWTLVAVFAVLGVAALRRWYRYRTAPAAWLAFAFSAIAFVVVAGRFLPEPPEAAWHTALEKVDIALLALMPYALYRFARHYAPAPSRWGLALATAVTGAVAVAGLVLAPLAPEGEPRTSVDQVYVMVFAAQWTVLSVVAAAVLWRSGRGQPRVTRARMRLLATGAMLLTLALLLAASLAGDESEAISTLTSLLAIASGVVFYLGFAPPDLLRAMLRQSVVRQAASVQNRLVAAATPADVAAVQVPFMSELLGIGAVFVDSSGQVLAAAGVPDDEAQMVALEVSTAANLSDAHVVAMRTGTLVLPRSRFVPFLSTEEAQLVQALAGQLDVGLERASLFEAEQRARRRAEEASAEVEQIVYGLSHDLTNPVSAIAGFAQLLDDPDLSAEERREFTARIADSAAYMNELLRDLLELARIGRAEAPPQPVDLTALVSRVAREVRSSHPSLEVRTGALPVLLVNPGRARQLFTNLLSNAARHGGREDITVRIQARPVSGEGIQLVVADDGRGIPPEHRDRVFDLFERVDQDRPGSGIGLTVVRRIVETIGGSVRLGDAARGAEFVIQLPPEVIVSGANRTSGVQ